jgi:hypothetical protein
MELSIFFILLLHLTKFAVGTAPQVVSATYEMVEVEIGSYVIEYAQIGTAFLALSLTFAHCQMSTLTRIYICL